MTKKRIYEAEEYEAAIAQRDAALREVDGLKAANEELRQAKETALRELQEARAERSQQVRAEIKENMRRFDDEGMQRVTALNEESRQVREQDAAREAMSVEARERIAQLEGENAQLKAENELLKAENAELREVVSQLTQKVELQEAKIQGQAERIQLQSQQIQGQQKQIEQQAEQIQGQQGRIDQQHDRLEAQQGQIAGQQAQIDEILAHIGKAPAMQQEQQADQAQEAEAEQAKAQPSAAQQQQPAAAGPVWLGSGMSMYVSREGNVFSQGANGDYNYDSLYTANLRSNPDLYKASVLRAGGAFNEDGDVIQYDQDGNAINGLAQDDSEWLEAYDGFEAAMTEAEEAYNQGIQDMDVDGLSQEEIDAQMGELTEARETAQNEAQDKFDAFLESQEQGNSISGSKEAGESLQPGQRQEQQEEQQADFSRSQTVGGEPGPGKAEDAPEQAEGAEQGIQRSAGQVEQEPPAAEQPAEQFVVQDDPNQYPVEETATNERRAEQADAAVEAQSAEPPGVAPAPDQRLYL